MQFNLGPPPVRTQGAQSCPQCADQGGRVLSAQPEGRPKPSACSSCCTGHGTNGAPELFLCRSTLGVGAQILLLQIKAEIHSRPLCLAVGCSRCGISAAKQDANYQADQQEHGQTGSKGNPHPDSHSLLNLGRSIASPLVERGLGRGGGFIDCIRCLLCLQLPVSFANNSVNIPGRTGSGAIVRILASELSSQVCLASKGSSPGMPIAQSLHWRSESATASPP